jgi:tetratricopeptide (TPR) repeat protein
MKKVLVSLLFIVAFLFTIWVIRSGNNIESIVSIIANLIIVYFPLSKELSKLNLKEHFERKSIFERKISRLSNKLVSLYGEEAKRLSDKDKNDKNAKSYYKYAIKISETYSRDKTYTYERALASLCEDRYEYEDAIEHFRKSVQYTEDHDKLGDTFYRIGKIEVNRAKYKEDAKQAEVDLGAASEQIKQIENIESTERESRLEDIHVLMRRIEELKNKE